MADEEAAAIYAAHAELRRLLALADESEMRRVEWYHDAYLTMPVELRFHDVAAVRRYVNTLVTVERTPPVTVHAKWDAGSAHYWAPSQAIFLPAEDASGWAMRQITILHEFAHHVEWSRHGSGGHGEVFREILLDLVERHAGEECALVLRTEINLHE